MKKSVFLSFFLACALMSNAWGGCGGSTHMTKDPESLIIIGGENYFCDYGSTYCSAGTIVVSISAGYLGNETSAQAKGYRYYVCNATKAANDDKWIATDITACNDPKANAKLAKDSTAERYITTHEQLSTDTVLLTTGTVVTNGAIPCFAYKCKGNKIPNSDGTACIENTDKNNCESTGGTWQDGSSKCDCSGNSDLEQDGDKKCKCINKEGQSYRWSGSACVTVKGGYTYGEVQTANANWQKTQTANRQACEASGGTYNKTCSCTAEHTSLQGSECVCNSGYKWKSNKKDGCEPTDNTMVELACKAAADKGQAQWNPYPSPGQCICKENGYVLDVNARECKPNEQRAICQPLMNANKARWDDVTGTCVCSQAGYALENGECVETEEAAAARKDKEMKSAKNKIEDVHSKLKRVQDGFKVSAWKNEEGKFNTARLASDSIAGVVLGTAGGLVTSKVVKKNQVENGFEDIQCTIGGQAVAQWGDDFSVGTQF